MTTDSPVTKASQAARSNVNSSAHSAAENCVAPVVSFINDTSTRDNVPGQPFIARNVMTISVKETGDYVLTITATKKPVVELLKTQLELRKNIATPK